MSTGFLLKLQLHITTYTQEHKANYFEVAAQQQHSSTGSHNTTCSKLVLLTRRKGHNPADSQAHSQAGSRAYQCLGWRDRAVGVRVGVNSSGTTTKMNLQHYFCFTFTTPITAVSSYDPGILARSFVSYRFFRLYFYGPSSVFVLDLVEYLTIIRLDIVKNRTYESALIIVKLRGHSLLLKHCCNLSTLFF